MTGDFMDVLCDARQPEVDFSQSGAEPHCFVFAVLPSQVFQVNGNGLTSG